MRRDLQELKLNESDAMHRDLWRKRIRAADPGWRYQTDGERERDLKLISDGPSFSYEKRDG